MLYFWKSTRDYQIMFGKKKTGNKTAVETSSSNNNSKKTTSNNTSGSACVIVKGTVIEGKFKTTNDTRMDGVIKGDFVCDARMIMGADALIEGNATTKQANIAGTFNGELKVSELLALANTAKVDGIITANELAVEDGASLNGTINIGK